MWQPKYVSRQINACEIGRYFLNAVNVYQSHTFWQAVLHHHCKAIIKLPCLVGLGSVTLQCNLLLSFFPIACSNCHITMYSIYLFTANVHMLIYTTYFHFLGSKAYASFQIDWHIIVKTFHQWQILICIFLMIINRFEVVT